MRPRNEGFKVPKYRRLHRLFPAREPALRRRHGVYGDQSFTDVVAASMTSEGQIATVSTNPVGSGVP